MDIFKKDWFENSNCPKDFIPAGTQPFVACDYGSPDKDYTVKGFYDPRTGEIHIQEISE